MTGPGAPDRGGSGGRDRGGSGAAGDAVVDGAGVRLVRAANPGPMTLTGTNTWVLPGGVVVDPGPLLEEHLRAVLAVAEGRVSVVLLTHRHPDHAEGAARFAERAGDVPVRAYDPALCVEAPALSDGESVQGLEALHVPGHTSDSMAFLLVGKGILLTGDTVLGRGPSVVAHPDGALGDYLDSLRRLRALAADGSVVRLLPGHGPIVTEPLAALDALLAHRAERLAAVRAAVAAGARSAGDVVARVYGDVEPGLRGAALQSVRAQLAYLEDSAAGSE